MTCLLKENTPAIVYELLMFYAVPATKSYLEKRAYRF